MSSTRQQRGQCSAKTITLHTPPFQSELLSSKGISKHARTNRTECEFYSESSSEPKSASSKPQGHSTSQGGLARVPGAWYSSQEDKDKKDPSRQKTDHGSMTKKVEASESEAIQHRVKELERQVAELQREVQEVKFSQRARKGLQHDPVMPAGSCIKTNLTSPGPALINTSAPGKSKAPGEKSDDEYRETRRLQHLEDLDPLLGHLELDNSGNGECYKLPTSTVKQVQDLLHTASRLVSTGGASESELDWHGKGEGITLPTWKEAFALAHAVLDINTSPEWPVKGHGLPYAKYMGLYDSNDETEAQNPSSRELRALYSAVAKIQSGNLIIQEGLIQDIICHPSGSLEQKPNESAHLDCMRYPSKSPSQVPAKDASEPDPEDVGKGNKRKPSKSPEHKSSKSARPVGAEDTLKPSPQPPAQEPDEPEPESSKSDRSERGKSPPNSPSPPLAPADDPYDCVMTVRLTPTTTRPEGQAQSAVTYGYPIAQEPITKKDEGDQIVRNFHGVAICRVGPDGMLKEKFVDSEDDEWYFPMGQSGR
ncbi:MAG: hypothetical protein M1831_006880 [Alyxoria varia]|nr:MAG: hypothetical protein M1831_006880 [Alyxoria varia]